MKILDIKDHVVSFGVSSRRMTGFVTIVSIILFVTLFGNTANAQECEIAKLDNSGSSSKKAQSNFTCLTSRISAALSRIEALEGELAPYRNARNMVAAFDRSDADSCPKGWVPFKPARGRVIVGAGVNTNVDQSGDELTDHASFQDDPSKATGGEEKHKLSVAEMPTHNHWISTKGGTDVHDGLAGNHTVLMDGIDLNFDLNAPAVGGHGVLRQVISFAGRDQSHNNMPPFLALFYCIKG